jgi:hypothetical protein
MGFRLWDPESPEFQAEVARARMRGLHEHNYQIFDRTWIPDEGVSRVLFVCSCGATHTTDFPQEILQ